MSLSTFEAFYQSTTLRYCSCFHPQNNNVISGTKFHSIRNAKWKTQHTIWWRRRTQAHEFYYLFWLKSPLNKKKCLFWRNYGKCEGKAWKSHWDEKERKTFLLSLQPNNENSVVSELKLSSTSSSYRAEKKEKLKRRLWVQTRGKNCGGARENVEQSESKYRLEWEWKSRGGEDVLFKFSSLFPLLLNAAAACIYLRLNKQKLLRFVIVLITLAFAILPDCAVVHMLEKQIAMRWEYTVLLLNY